MKGDEVMASRIRRAFTASLARIHQILREQFVRVKRPTVLHNLNAVLRGSIVKFCI